MIPFEGQYGGSKERRCGAAALCMIYRSFGLDCSQEDVWQRVSYKSHSGRVGVRTNSLANDAIAHGLSATVVQASEPWPLLHRLHQQNVRVILSHRPGREATVGHYSVLVAISDTGLEIHDPGFGPNRPWSRDTFLNLWKPRGPRCEIAGNAPVAISTPDGEREESCSVCKRPIPLTMSCRHCGKTMPLEPTASLGCLDASCSERHWRRVLSVL